MVYGQRKNDLKWFLKNIRDKGYYVSVNEHNISLFAISMLVIADNGHFLGILTLSGPISRFNDIRQKELLSLLTKYVRNIHIPLSYKRRCLFTSKSITPVATDTFKLSAMPCMGILAN